MSNLEPAAAPPKELTKSRLIAGIARVDLRVQDIGRAVAFYRGIVGLEVVEQEADRAALGAGGEVFLTLTSRGVTAPADPGATGLFHTAFRFPDRAALGDALARVVEAEIELSAGDHLVSEALYVDDPDGNGVELYWDRPREQWPPPANGMLIPMATLAVDLQSVYAEGRGRAAVAERAPAGTDVGHVHLQVADIAETHGFYAGLLGLDQIARLGASAAFFSSLGYHHNIGTNTWRSRGGKPAGRERAGLERVVFAVQDTAEIERLRELPGAAVTSGEVVLRDPSDIELRFAA